MAFVAGQKLRAKDLNDAIGVLKVQPTDLVRNNSTVLTDVPGMVFDVEAGASYSLEGLFYFKSPATARANIKWVVPTGSSGYWGLSGAAAGMTGPSPTGPRINYIDHGVIPFDNTSEFGVQTDTEFSTVPVRANPTGILYVTTTGTIKAQFKQGVAIASNSTMMAGSWARLSRLS